MEMDVTQIVMLNNTGSVQISLHQVTILNITIIHIASQCKPIWGDGVLISSDEGCDDGNLYDGDGWTEECVVETGWDCTGGSMTSTDVWEEICQDGLVVGSEKCDDKNAINGDGCDINCEVEPYWKCINFDSMGNILNIN